MYFLLRSEVEIHDLQKGYLKKDIFCPYCGKTQIKKKEQKKLYKKYTCWNKRCPNRNASFIVIENYIQYEESFNLECEFCQESLDREFVNSNRKLYLKFKCQSKICVNNYNPLLYDLTNNRWKNYALKKNLEELDNLEDQTKKEETELPASSTKAIIDNDSQIVNPMINLEASKKMPLLEMDEMQYEKFLLSHNGKVVVLVDLPNFIRTLKSIYPHNFMKSLQKARKLLFDFIINTFHTDDRYVIQYYSKPAQDLNDINLLFNKFCQENNNHEHLHLLNLLKGDGYSDIDNYLIANAIEIIERCNIKGFVIISSDKDFLPVMRIAHFRKIKSFIVGINTPEIYEKYQIDDIKFLGIMRFFDKFKN